MTPLIFLKFVHVYYIKLFRYHLQTATQTRTKQTHYFIEVHVHSHSETDTIVKNLYHQFTDLQCTGACPARVLFADQQDLLNYITLVY